MYIKLLQFYRYINKCERLDSDELNLINFNRLKRLAIYAFENVDYYKELYDSNNFDPYSLSGMNDLPHLPIVNKDHFRHTPIEKRISKEYNHKDIIELSTSGSTGQPLVFCTNRLEISKQTLKWMYVLRKYGYKPTDNIIQIYRPLPNPNKNFIQKFGLFRRKIVSIFDSMDKIIDELVSTRVDFLAGIKSSLVIVGEELFKRNITLRPKYLVTTGEVLTDNDRKLLSMYYDTKTIDIYATSETGNIAFTCPRCDYLHIHLDSIFINTHAHAEGLHITSLENYVTPIINYNLADTVVYLENYDCGCGSHFPMIQNIVGREGDYIISSTGRKHNSQYFTAKLKFIDFLDQYKIVQDKDGSIVIRLKLNKTTDDSERQQLRKSVIAEFHEIAEKNRLEVEFVDNFSVGQHGKFRVIENELIDTNRQSED
jgi:phenylacetate-CoA ligase